MLYFWFFLNIAHECRYFWLRIKNALYVYVPSLYRIEETWRLWQKFKEDYERFADWLEKSEQAIAAPNTSCTPYIIIKEEIKKYEVSLIACYSAVAVFQMQFSVQEFLAMWHSSLTILHGFCNYKVSPSLANKHYTFVPVFSYVFALFVVLMRCTCPHALMRSATAGT